jgi:hypothetical protein
MAERALSRSGPSENGYRIQYRKRRHHSLLRYTHSIRKSYLFPVPRRTLEIQFQSELQDSPSAVNRGGDLSKRCKAHVGSRI